MRRWIVEYDILRGEEIVFHGKDLMAGINEAEVRKSKLFEFLTIPPPGEIQITSVVEWQVEA